MFWLLPVSLLIVFELIADVFAKEYSLKGNWYFWALAIAAYIIGNIFWLWGIRSGSGLARGAMLFSVGSAVAATFIGIHFFGENVGKLQLLGIFLGIVAIMLLLWE